MRNVCRCTKWNSVLKLDEMNRIKTYFIFTSCKRAMLSISITIYAIKLLVCSKFLSSFYSLMVCLCTNTGMTACLPLLLLQLHLNPTVYGLACILICFFCFFSLCLAIARRLFFGEQNNRSLTITTTKDTTKWDNGITTFRVNEKQWRWNRHPSIQPSSRFNEIKFTFESRQVFLFFAVHKWNVIE